MLILIVFVLLMIGSALTYNVYSIFKPFINNLWNIQNYNIAYRWAMSSIERAELVLRYHIAWFEWSGWWINNTEWWPDSDKKTNEFWLLSISKNWFYRQIKSKVNGNTIPSNWNWNIEYDLQRTGTDYGGPSKNFNKLDYNISEEILLYYDNTSSIDYYYSWVEEIKDVWASYISWTIRLPPKINKKFWEQLATSIDLDEDGISDDIIVNRTIFGKDSNWNDFSIIPTIDVDYDTNSIKWNDTAIREDVINNMSDQNNPWYLSFWNNKNPRCWTTDYSCTDPTYHNIIPEDSSFSGETFTNIFTDSSVNKLHLKFSIVNLMKTNWEKIYPFLEYKLYLNWVSTISDRFFHIMWVWKVNEYKVIIRLAIPVVKSTAASDFTILF